MGRINVTQTFLPPIEEYQAYLGQIWSSRRLTNQGPLLLEFEEKAAKYLGVQNIHFVSNGTVALQLALNALGIADGEVITTPFSYVATTSSILWERCTPVFVDIEPESFCIDPDKIEAAITDKTKAIMAVHVFGTPCDIEAIDAIAKRHGLKVIYDGAHAFGVEYAGRSVFDYGDVTTCSFHATKLFHTIEGGAVIVKDPKASDKVELAKRFGHTGDDHFQLGINAKASEYQAAMGLCNLKYIDGLIGQRQAIARQYRQLLGPRMRTLRAKPRTKPNYAYFPLVLEGEGQVLKTMRALAAQDIYPRRYFYPSLNELPYLNRKHSCPISEHISRSILCLPQYPGLKGEDVERICAIIKATNPA